MSLTSVLTDPTSAMSCFLAEHLPFTEKVVADLRTRLKNWPAPVVPDAGAGRRPEYPMLGHTIDHRLRISLGAPTGGPIQEGVVRTVIDDAGWPSPEIIGTVMAAGTALLKELERFEDEAGQPLALEAEAEERLIRLCHLASHFETIFRCGGWVRGNRLGLCSPGADLDDLAAMVPDYVVADIRCQMALAAEPGPFSRLRELPAQLRVCGPAFDGSTDVGGADADFILDGKLIDCKATIRPGRLGQAEIYQLVGYLLLDYSNAYAINGVGLYLSRQGALIDWSVEDFLGLLGARLDLETLRAACRYALTGGAEGDPPPAGGQRDLLPPPRTRPAVQETLFDAE
ncbi:hypothetical protein SSP35_34_00160 [Streptomyces sp. NBRC 110611]|uniref:hypothetical protein n=1 Tax=Streptomyces sp. NBRC 110611 TaxID=1621259 RepID=UPI0008557F51|nr:hypothetical protein [Streptomyces sp. NBRC 110611]GAU71331.1 hypothetical protein SSP35_34_00160 [Streptomyces sp. NBRC 110611]